MSKKIFLLLFLTVISFPLSAAELEIMRVVPQGKGIKDADKIVFEFDQPVVPLGEMERDSEDVGVFRRV